MIFQAGLHACGGVVHTSHSSRAALSLGEAARSAFLTMRSCANSAVPNARKAPWLPGGALPTSTDTVTVHFLDPNTDGLPRRQSVQAPVGSTLVDVAKSLGADIHAACGQKLQCATCHVILQKSFYDKLQPPGVREEDLLESTFTLTPTSRLGCQVRLTPELDGIQCELPDKAAKGNVRMSLSQARPRVTKQWTSVPAVPTRASLMNGVINGSTSIIPDTNEALASLQQQLDDERSLRARIESELRQLRAKSEKQGGRGEGAMDRVKEAAKNASSEGQGSDANETDDLSKIKLELERTRVDVEKMGRKVGFEDVIGLDAAKLALREAVIWPAVADPALFSGIRGSLHGLLLYGPPGCGKTMLARAAAVELADRASFFHVRPGDVMSKFYGESQRRIQALEELVKEAAPAVIFFDEVDSLLGSRDGGNVAEHHRATTNALLAWMDGFGTGDERVFFLGATNRAEAIDEAALRRFGDVAEVEAPNSEARLALLRHLILEKAAKGGHVAALTDSELESVAGSSTEGYSLADVDHLVRRAFFQVLRELPGGVRPGLRPEDVPPVKLEHFTSALKDSSGTSALRSMLKKRGQSRAQL